MKNSLLIFITAASVALPSVHYAQAPNLGSTASFVLFSSNGAVTNTGLTHLTGNVGTNNGASTAFGNIDGVIHDGDAISIAATTDLLVAYNQLDLLVPTIFPAPSLGNGQTLNPGVHAIAGNSTLNNTLTLNGQGDPDAVFVIQIQGTFSASAGSKIALINGTKACNVFWKVEGLVSIATGASIKGTVIANNAAITMASGASLEGRAFSTTGAVTVNSIKARTPIGCGSPTLNGPTAADLGTLDCFGLFSGNGPVTNTGVTFVIGDVGTNSGLTTGYSDLNVTGTIHPTPDNYTQAAANDLLIAYSYLNLLPYDIELLYPAQLGNSLVLTPHTYLLDGATTLTDTLFLNAQGNPDAVFVMQINGALTTGTYATVVLLNGAQADRIFWKIDGAVSINNYSIFKGNIICNNGAISNINTGSTLEGKALTTNGALNTTAIVTTMSTLSCENLGIETSKSSIDAASFYPNPFKTSFIMEMSNASEINGSELRIYSITGALVVNIQITKSITVIEPILPAGIYTYKVISNNKTVQSGKLISQQ